MSSLGSQQSWFDRGMKGLYTQGLREQAKPKVNRAFLSIRSQILTIKMVLVFVTLLQHLSHLIVFLKDTLSIFFLKKLREQLSCKKYKKYPRGCRANRENTTHSSSKTRKQITTAHRCLKKPLSVITVSWLWEQNLVAFECLALALHWFHCNFA